MRCFKLKYLSLIVLIVISGSLANAAVVRDLPMRMTHPDGSELELLASGDEYHNWLHDASSEKRI